MYKPINIHAFHKKIHRALIVKYASPIKTNVPFIEIYVSNVEICKQLIEMHRLMETHALLHKTYKPPIETYKSSVETCNRSGETYAYAKICNPQIQMHTLPKKTHRHFVNVHKPLVEMQGSFIEMHVSNRLHRCI